MNRFYSRDTMTLDPDGQYVLHTDAQKYVDDSNVKSANLKLLVEKILAAEESRVLAVDGGGDIGDIADAEQLYGEIIDLARSLKQ